MSVLLSVPVLAQAVSQQEMSTLIDERLGLADSMNEAQWADDATLLRRMSLDLVGRIPTAAEVRTLLAQPSIDSRRVTIARLLNSGSHHRQMATFWRRAWVPQTDTPEYRGLVEGLETWLTEELQTGTRYDELVSQVLLWKANNSQPNSIDARGFYVANEFQPANLAASSTRAFLGLNLDCAQCHDHPFSRWTREQFWQTAAFFVEPHDSLPTILIPETTTMLEPQLLDGSKLSLTSPIESQQLKEGLLQWIKSENEQFMARNAVNRLWAHFFGRALVEPMDDLSIEATGTNPNSELLKELATRFTRSGYDQRVLIEGIVGSNAYRLNAHQAEVSDSNSKEAEPWRSVMSVRGLSGEQLFDSLATAAGLAIERDDVRRGQQQRSRDEFAALFYVERPVEAERSISQSLTLMNGAFVNELATIDGNPMLRSIVSSPFLSAVQKIDSVFVSVLGRLPSEQERIAVLGQFDRSSEASFDEHLENLFWALVNTPEFCTNH